MSNNINTKCPTCENEFKATQKNVIHKAVKIVFFECPFCDSRYLIYAEDKEVKKGLDKTRRLLKKYNKSSGDKRVQYWNKVQKQKKKNQDIMGSKIQEHDEIIKEVINHKIP